MKLGIIGTGRWAHVYARKLQGLGIDFWMAEGTTISADTLEKTDGIIIANAGEKHFPVAMKFAGWMPLLIEKPVCMSYADADTLLKVSAGGIVFAGHTRLYSTAWRELKRKALLEGVKSYRAEYGGRCRLGPLWDKGSHLVAMAIDLTGDCNMPSLRITDEETPLRFVVNDHLVFTDTKESPDPLEVLITEFVAAIKKKRENLEGLRLGVEVVEILEAVGYGIIVSDAADHSGERAASV